MKNLLIIGLGSGIVFSIFLIGLGVYGTKAFGNIEQGMKIQNERSNLKSLEDTREVLGFQLTDQKDREFQKATKIGFVEKDLEELNEELAEIVSKRNAVSTDIERNICDQAVSRSQIHRLNGESIPQEYPAIVTKFDCQRRFENVPLWLKAETVTERTEIVHRTVLEDIVPAQEWAGGLLDQFDNRFEESYYDNPDVWTQE